MFRRAILEKLSFNQNIKASSEAKDFIKRLLTKGPKKRLGSKGGAIELMNHSFLSTFNWNALLAKTAQSPYNPLKDVEDWKQNF